MSKRGRLLAATSRRADLRLMRVIKCLRLLERSCYSAKHLAGHFGVSKRTVYRDLRVLALAGVPLARSKRPPGRGYHVPAEPTVQEQAALAQGRHHGYQPTAPGLAHHHAPPDRPHV